MNKKQELYYLESTYVNCGKCSLGRTDFSNNKVFGSGNFNADIVLIGEAPGKEEDKQGKPFVGKSGQLLTSMLNEVNIDRNEVYITNTVLCRPPNNRNPKIEEIKTCFLRLRKQIQIIKPQVLVLFGNTPLFLTEGKMSGITKIRGKVKQYDNFKVIPTFHPAYVMRNNNKRKYIIEDLKLVKKIIE